MWICFAAMCAYMYMNDSFHLSVPQLSAAEGQLENVSSKMAALEDRFALLTEQLTELNQVCVHVYVHICVYIFDLNALQSLIFLRVAHVLMAQRMVYVYMAQKS